MRRGSGASERWGRAATCVRLALALGGLATWSATAASCVDSHEPTDPVPLARFCTHFFDALCEPIESCPCSEAAVAACRAEEAELCRTFPSVALGAAVDEGRVRYDGSRAHALIQQMQARGATCAGFISTIDWQVRDLLSLGGVFEGSVAAGEACEPLGFELVNECRVGSCAPDGSAHTCRAVVGPGERCDAHHQCADLEGTLTPERGIDRLTLRCVPDTPGGVEGECVAWIDEGGECTVDGACWGSSCQAGFCQMRDEGAPCFSGRECVSGYCSGTERVCRSGEAEPGDPCDDPTACASHVCVGGTCEPAGCGTF